jgi:hypothetical protein
VLLTKGKKMFISNDDLGELKRLAANTYEQDRSEQIQRIIRGINKLESTVAALTSENKRLKEEAKK